MCGVNCSVNPANHILLQRLFCLGMAFSQDAETQVLKAALFIARRIKSYISTFHFTRSCRTVSRHQEILPWRMLLHMKLVTIFKPLWVLQKKSLAKGRRWGRGNTTSFR